MFKEQFQSRQLHLENMARTRLAAKILSSNRSQNDSTSINDSVYNNRNSYEHAENYKLKSQSTPTDAMNTAPNASPHWVAS